MAKPDKLTAKQELFCQEYIKDFNATRAAKAAGYSANIPSETGYENLRKPQIQAYLNKLLEKRSLRTEITQDRILQELAFIAFFDIRNLFDDDGNLKPVTELDEKTARALASVDVLEEFNGKGADRALAGYIRKIKALDKKAALELLGKHLGMFTDTIRIEDANAEFDNYLRALYAFLSEGAKAEFRAFTESYRPTPDSSRGSIYSTNLN